MEPGEGTGTKVPECHQTAKKNTWRSHCESINTLSQAQRLQKVLSRDETTRFGTLRTEDGGHTVDGKETLGLLLKCHFPGHRDATATPSDEETLPDTSSPTTSDWHFAAQVVSLQKIRWAIQSFEPYKAPGPDGIYPVLMQVGLELILQRLCRLFKSSIAFGYIPSAWRGVDVRFIPKAGRNSYDQPKDFRPISLMSFMLKTMERLLDRHIRDVVLAASPLHASQYAYQSGKSTEDALCALVKKAQESLDNKGVTLATFLDISGAFDNATHESMIEAAVKRGVNPTGIRWIKSMLTNRRINATLYDASATILATRGCPQGGVLSPLLWIMVIHGLLRRLSDKGYYAQGYADDVVIVAMGPFLDTVSDILQGALQLAERWCRSRQLEINPAKTALVPFTRKRKLDALKLPTLFGQEIQISHQAKYLGVILDHTLTWTPHILNRIRKATNIFCACRRAYGPTWGLKPKVVWWLYRTIVLPTLTYAAGAWWPKTLQKTAAEKLNRVQRLACLGMTGAMRTTPTATMEVLLNLPPLHTVVREKAMAYHLRATFCGRQTAAASAASNTALAPLLKANPIIGSGLDKMPKRYAFNRNFEIDIGSRESWEGGELRSPPPGALVWYTDGSKTNNGTGAGIFGEAPRASVTAGLGKLATVFQAEVHALAVCAAENLRRRYREQRIYVYSDSQAAISAVGGNCFNSHLVWECRQLLQELASRNKVKLIWIPAHRGHSGNERADRLAKQAANGDFCGPEPALRLPWCSVKVWLKDWTSRELAANWKNQSGLRQSRLFVLEPPGEAKARQLLSLNRQELRTLVGLFTGHCGLRKHLSVIRVHTDSTLCRKCELADETAHHVLCECVALARSRAYELGQAFPEASDYMNFPLRSVLRFVKSTALLG